MAQMADDHGKERKKANVLLQLLEGDADTIPPVTPRLAEASSMQTGDMGHKYIASTTYDQSSWETTADGECSSCITGSQTLSLTTDIPMFFGDTDPNPCSTATKKNCQWEGGTNNDKFCGDFSIPSGANVWVFT